jgi:(3R)-3-hydroxyacyl-CoA dehydrogenase / 3a,7a,12a-trihydroxy-5b-cholest-24-enoyl-CoA hydratase / enoyl-CoA hydratase 2
LTNFDQPLYHKTIEESTNHCISAGTEFKTADTSQNSEASKPESKDVFRYDFKDTILYALSLGVSTRDLSNLKFLYENDPNFCVLPTFGVIPAFPFLSTAFNSLPNNIQIDPAKLLHGEQYLELYMPLKTSDVLLPKARLVDILDKGSGALLILNGN